MKTALTTFAFALALLWGAASFAQQPPSSPVDEKKIAIGAKEKSPEELKQLMGSGTKYMLIHVDPADRFEKETIPGAVNIPLAELPERLKTISKDTVLVFACNSGPRRSRNRPASPARAIVRLGNGRKKATRLSRGRNPSRNLSRARNSCVGVSVSVSVSDLRNLRKSVASPSTRPADPSLRSRVEDWRVSLR
jgi:hypothetical protein